MANRKIGKYEVIERLGRGGMAEVYRAYQSSLDRYVAIKVLHAFLADDPEFKSRFEREAQNIAKLKHPNIVQVYDFDYDTEGESYYMVMELVDGTTLKDRVGSIVARGELLPISEVIRIIREAAGALAYAHSRNMIHRDVKPANLMLDHDNRVVLTDFGIAKIVTGAQFTASGGMVGTPAFMAPEQGLGEAGDERSDLYSLGIIMFQLLVGKLPYDADTPLAIILKHLNSPTPSIRDFKPDLPATLDRIVSKAIAKEPVERYQSASELIEDLERFANNHHPDSDQPQSFFVSPDENSSHSASDTTVEKARLGMSASRSNSGLIRVGAILSGIVALLVIGVATRIIPFPGINGSVDATLTASAVLDAATSVDTAIATSEVVVAPTDTIAPTFTSTESPSHTPTESPTPSATPATPIAVSAQLIGNVTARVGPGQSFAQIMVVQAAEEVVILGRSEDNLWFKVRKSNNQEGWVQSGLMNAYGNIASVPVVPAPTLTPTNTLTFTPTSTMTPSPTWSPTPSITATSTKSPTPDPRQTSVALTQAASSQQATEASCNWDYASEIAADYPTYDANCFYLIPANTEFTLKITLVNLGTCDWVRNTALIYESGENYDADRVIFFVDRDRIVNIGDEAVVEFDGKSPDKGGTKTGRWILRTPGQIPIGLPLEISIQVYEQGTPVAFTRGGYG
ncbi:MAG: protein kinase [Anaerolineae bacterium]